MKKGQVWREVFPGGVEEGIGLNKKKIHIRYNVSMWHHIVVSHRIFSTHLLFSHLNRSTWERQKITSFREAWAWEQFCFRRVNKLPLCLVKGLEL